MREARPIEGRASFIVDTHIMIHQAELQGANGAYSLEALSTCCFAILLGTFRFTWTTPGAQLETTQACAPEVSHKIESSGIGRGNHAVDMSQKDLLKESLHRNLCLQRKARKIRQRLNGHPGKGYRAMDRIGIKIDLWIRRQAAELSLVGRDEIHEDGFLNLPAVCLIACSPQRLRCSGEANTRLRINRAYVHEKADSEALPNCIDFDNKIQLSGLAPGLFDTRRLDDYLSATRPIPMPAINSFAQFIEQCAAYSFELSENAPEQSCPQAMVFIRVEEIGQAGDNDTLCAFIVGGGPENTEYVHTPSIANSFARLAMEVRVPSMSAKIGHGWTRSLAASFNDYERRVIENANSLHEP